MKTTCPKCGEPVTAAMVGEQLVFLSPEVDYSGTVLAIDGRATYLTGRALIEARRMQLSVYSRHGVVCRAFWNHVE